MTGEGGGPAEGTPGGSPALPRLNEIFISFLFLGTTSFGGPAMVPHIRLMAVEKRGWLTDTSFRNGIALCQSIPGATAIQMSGYVGYRLRGIPGALAAYAGFALPAFLMVVVLSALYVQTSALPLAVILLQGLRAVVVAIVAHAALTFARASLTRRAYLLIAAVAFVLFLAGIHPILVIGLAALLGVVLMRSEAIPSVAGEEKPSPGHGIPYLALLGITLAGFLVLWILSPLLLEIAAVFFRVDLFAFGGGLAALPVMYHDVVTVRGWVTPQAFLDGIAIGQITPGPIVITATFLGYLVAGFPGAIVATLAIFVPSFLVVVGTIPYFDRIRGSPRLIHALGGIVCSFAGLLFMVAIRFALDVTWTVPLALLCITGFVALWRGIGVQWVVAGAVAVSVLAGTVL
ncbi:MAG: chromate efflux transporter [Methanomicrobiales archaeon]|nr:chromate efflux transporter [Methanomicrobiales archaeon]